MYNIGFDIFAKDRASKVFDQVGNAAKGAEGKASHAHAGMAAGAAGAALAVVEWGKKSMEAYNEVAEATLILSKTAGVPAATASAWIAAGKEWNVSSGDVIKGLGFLSKQAYKSTSDFSKVATAQNSVATAQEGVSKAVKKFGKASPQAASAVRLLNVAHLNLNNVMRQGVSPFKQLGISAMDAHGKIKPMGQLLPQVEAALAKMPAGAERTALGQRLLGKSFVANQLYWTRSIEDQKKSTEEATKNGEVIGNKQVQDYLKNRLAQKQMAAQMEGLKVMTAGALIPALLHLTTTLLNVGEWVQKNTAWLKPLMGVLAGGIGVIWGIHKAMTAWTVIQKVFNATLKDNPIGITITVIAALAVGAIYCYNHFKTFRTVVNEAWRVVKVGAHAMWFDVVLPVFRALKSWASSLWSTLSAWGRNVRAVWTSVGHGLQTVWNNVIHPVFKYIVSSWLTTAGWIIHGAATMLGWVPGVGGKLRRAAAEFDKFRDNVNRALNGVHPRTVGVTANFSWAAQQKQSASNAKNKHAAMGFANGGPVTGGIPGVDSVPIVAMPNEFVVRADGSNLGDAIAHFGQRMAAGGVVLKARTPSNASISRKAQAGWAADFLKNVPGAIEGMLGAGGGFGGAGGGGGGARWASVIAKVLSMLGQSMGWIGAIERRINLESGGNPHAINLWDSNAQAGHPSKGLMQTIDGTFNTWAGPFRSLGIWNPLANIFAGTNYALHTYGSLGNIDPRNRPYGYDRGGYLPPGLSTVYNGTGRVETVSPPGAGLMGGGGRPVVVQLVADGRIIQQILLNHKRRNGGIELGIA